MEYANEYAAQGFSAGYTAVSLCISILAIVGLWKMYAKAGEPGWKSIIPIYNTYILFKLVWGNGWKFLLLLVPIVNIVILIMIAWKTGKAYGGGTGISLLCVFFPTIAYLVLGFGNFEYVGPQ